MNHYGEVGHQHPGLWKQTRRGFHNNEIPECKGAMMMTSELPIGIFMQGGFGVKENWS